MTLEERIARIENILISDGKLTPIPGPTYEEAMADIDKGDNSTFIKYLIKNPPVYPLRHRANNKKSLSKGCGEQ
jgi:hypothetical protein